VKGFFCTELLEVLSDVKGLFDEKFGFVSKLKEFDGLEVKGF
jgi:hypothetical protein